MTSKFEPLKLQLYAYQLSTEPVHINTMFKVYRTEGVRSAVEGLSNAQLIGGDSICYVCKKHREGGVYDKQLVYCLQCWADKWFPVFAEKKEGAE